MKKSLVLPLAACAVFSAVALIARLAVQVSLHSLNVPAIISSLFAAGLLLTVFSDYSRKPHFRAGRAPRANPRMATPATSSEINPAWTYTTLSA